MIYILHLQTIFVSHLVGKLPNTDTLLLTSLWGTCYMSQYLYICVNWNDLQKFDVWKKRVVNYMKMEKIKPCGQCLPVNQACDSQLGFEWYHLGVYIWRTYTYCTVSGGVLLLYDSTVTIRTHTWKQFTSENMWSAMRKTNFRCLTGKCEIQKISLLSTVKTTAFSNVNVQLSAILFPTLVGQW